MSDEEKADDVYENMQAMCEEINRLMSGLSPEKLPKVVYEVSEEGYFRHVLPIISQVNKCAKELRRMVIDEVLLGRDIPRMELADLSDVSQATLSRWGREIGAVRSRR